MNLEEEEKVASSTQEIDFCTLGMFIIDEIHFLPPLSPVYDILGGAGAYAALGARLFSPPPLSRTISWIVDEGSDFPSSIRYQISAWDTTCLIRSDPSRLTTRGWNGYDSNQNRAFKYTTPKLRLDETSLDSTLLFSKSFHLICSPRRCTELVTSILRRRKRENPGAPKPLFIWEPVPDLCTPSELLNTTNTLPYVDICSPNHHELASLLGDPDLGLDPLTGEVSKSSVERACEQLLSSMPLQSYSLVIRCGAKGCYVAKTGGRVRRPSVVKRKRPNHARGGLTPEVDMMALLEGLMNEEREIVQIDPGVECWIPAYFQGESESQSKPDSHTEPLPQPPPDEKEKLVTELVDSKPDTPKHQVVDPTGGGNAFLGGLAVALARGKEVVEAAAWGSVAASLAIEQVGMPVLGSDESGRETWNGVVVEERLEEFMKRCQAERGVGG
ncbi:Uncharacterized protein BP5553_08137 [Venustampulla echinocandica]|uniref:Carbohydrate kinase PfkB domain-containing protein n=1 Tax=Venustampulla echinocandica TaxID=2656787 RepID=A0A370TFU1_9HELO|nr:Uncharacterized protein BP5553_08137 [Venustampulla echinocandica]RDL33769.1 Uncharacterized protein BP5553_08137 [Venustampulla echinocandica]